MNKIIAMVPIKLSNERLPGKNTKLLGTKPLIHYCLETLYDISYIDKIFIYCSDKIICKFIPNKMQDKVAFLQRDKNLDLPTSNFTQFFGEFSKTIASDIYVCAHATAPFVEKETINKGIEAVISQKFDSAFCVEKMQDFFWTKKNNPLNFDAGNIPRSQDIEPIYRETSGVYIFTGEVFKNTKRRVGSKPFLMEVSKREAVDINSSEDFQFAELMLNFKTKEDM